MSLGLPPFEECDNDCRTYLWVNTTTDSGEVFRRKLNPKSSERNFVYRFTNPPDGFAISVRLVKDEEKSLLALLRDERQQEEKGCITIFMQQKSLDLD